MGLYNEFLLHQLETCKAQVWVESPLQIKRSLGIQRGKSDKADSLRIAHYAKDNCNKARLYVAPREEVSQLKRLNALRLRLQSAGKALRVAVKENRQYLKKSSEYSVRSHCTRSLQALEADLAETLENMQILILSDERLSHLYEILLSVSCIGPVVAMELLITTNEFKSFTNAKKYACYAGIAPFEHTSGTSVKGKVKVSHLANKRIKSLLHIAAMSAIIHKGEYQQYYKRKVGEGKAKMSVLNAVRNKIIHRPFACVRDDRLYSV